LHARRLVAQKCLYGVDRNPMAVDLARLSLWLATLARDHEFTFLDHALKSGDSLVGLTRNEIAAANWDSSRPGLPMFRTMIKDAVDRAREGREAIRNAGDDVLCAAQAARYARVQDASAPARIVGDAVIAAYFSVDKARAREEERQKVESRITTSLQPDWDELQIKGLDFCANNGWRPFHWEIEFPEVFARENAGFDAIVGNPPFLGGTNISGSLGDRYLSYLKESAEGAGNRSDLVAYFFQRAFKLLSSQGAAGFIATNTISQGDTREAAPVYVLRHGGAIYRVMKRFSWPGEAAVIVSIVHFCKTQIAVPKFINGKAVDCINSYLLNSIQDGSPSRLAPNMEKTYKGLDIYGSGFLFDDEDNSGASNGLARMGQIQSSRPESRARIFPYIGGQEVNSDPRHNPHRYVFDINDLDELDARERFPELMEIAEQKVKPERIKLRDNVDGRRLKANWWRFNRTRDELFSKTALMRQVIVTCRVSPQFSIAILPDNLKFADSLIVFTFETLGAFATIQSRVHELWARFFASSLKDDLRYTPSDCFETFPLPEGFENSPTLEIAGQTYHDHRADLMVAANEGMTKTYNRFHKSDERSEPIRRLRDLHDEMDRAVLRAYGWHDLAEELRPEFLTEETEDDHTYQGRYFWPAEARDRVLARLLALNATRHAEEVAAGLAPSAKTGRKAADDDDDGQDSLDLD
jgi:hypothetical protein